MTPNLNTAIAELRAALDHARAGIDYYTQQAAQIEAALATLQQIGGAPALPRKPKAKTQPKAKAKAKANKAPQAKPAPQARPELPVIQRDYWIDLARRQPGPRAALLAAAQADLKIAPGTEAARMLVSRMGFQLSDLTRKQLLVRSDDGVYSAPAAA